MVSCVAEPTATLKLPDVAEASTPDVNCKVYPVPILSIFRFVNVAVPPDEVAVSVPESVPLPALFEIAAVTTVALSPVIVFPPSSWM